MFPAMSSMSKDVDQQVFVGTAIGGQYMFSDAYLNKVSSYNMERYGKMTNTNMANASGTNPNQNENQPKSQICFYEAEDARQNTWSWKGRLETPEDNSGARNGSVCAPTLSQSMQILNNKIMAVQSNQLSGQKSEESDLQKGKDSDSVHCEVSTDVNARHTENLNKLRISRAFSDPNSTNSIFRPAPHSSASLSHLSALQQQQQRHKTEDSVYKISEELEKTYLDGTTNSTPWHELQSEENCRPEDENCAQDCELENSDKYVQVQSLDGSTMVLSDQELASLRSNSSSRIYNNQAKDQVDQSQTQGLQISRSQEPPRPRMILGANSLKQSPTDEKMKAEVEESNRRISEMLGLFPNKEQSSCNNPTSVRIQENSMQNQQTASLVMNGQLQGIIQQGNAHSLSTGQISRMQVAGSKLQAPMAMTQQMYCVPNILMPQNPVPSPAASRQSNLVPIQGMMTSMPSASRFPQGMIRVPFVDMSRVVYVHQMPVNISSTHPNNNHNNSSSSNPHVNTSNIITINTNDNDFSASGQNDKSGRPIRSSGIKNKTTFIKMRSGSEEFAVPILGMRPSMDDAAACPRPIKTRTNPWDQDLDHDFSNSLMSKTVSLENISGLTDPSMCPSDVTMMYPDLSTFQSGNLPSDPATKTATFMQWPASADMHPEMLDMLPVRRAMPEDCGTGRLCWPEMEFLMSSREQLQSARRSNKPMGSNKANLISIIPKNSAADGVGAIGKESRFDKPDAKFL
ncbi:hypothetical protein Btru_053258 [Bulinus truncatus]|nr:hypothetical protein Btru_053258 [Bulinus truncatus]